MHSPERAPIESQDRDQGSQDSPLMSEQITQGRGRTTTTTTPRIQKKKKKELICFLKKKAIHKDRQEMPEQRGMIIARAASLFLYLLLFLLFEFPHSTRLSLGHP